MTARVGKVQMKKKRNEGRMTLLETFQEELEFSEVLDEF
jgi:hypothetical protein